MAILREDLVTTWSVNKAALAKYLDQVLNELDSRITQLEAQIAYSNLWWWQKLWLWVGAKWHGKH